VEPDAESDAVRLDQQLTLPAGPFVRPPETPTRATDARQAEHKLLVQWLTVWGVDAFDRGRIPWRWFQWLARQIDLALTVQRVVDTRAQVLANGLTAGAPAARRAFESDLREALSG
jgi:hypothetical protein